VGLAGPTPSTSRPPMVRVCSLLLEASSTAFEEPSQSLVKLV
jgi:hypothetical protein